MPPGSIESQPVHERAGALPPHEGSQDRGAAQRGAPRSRTSSDVGSDPVAVAVWDTGGRSGGSTRSASASPSATCRAVRSTSRGSRGARAGARAAAREVASSQPARERGRPGQSTSPGGTSSPGRAPSGADPSASGRPPTSVATTGMPRASASVTDHPVGLPPRRGAPAGRRRRTRRSSCDPVSGPGEGHPVGDPAVASPVAQVVDEARGRGRARRRHVHRQSRSRDLASASSRTSCPFARTTAPTQSSSPPEPRPRRPAGVEPGAATWTRPRSARSRRAPSRGPTRSSSPPARRGASGRPVSLVVAQRHVQEHDDPQPRASRGSSASGAEATSPSTSTVPPSGTDRERPRRVPAGRRRRCSCTAHPPRRQPVDRAAGRRRCRRWARGSSTPSGDARRATARHSGRS